MQYDRVLGTFAEHFAIAQATTHRLRGRRGCPRPARLDYGKWAGDNGRRGCRRARFAPGAWTARELVP
jgi:hypothetical protein